MSKVEDKVCRDGFQKRKAARSGDTKTDGKSLFLHGREIARWDIDGTLMVTLAGYATRTTLSRLRAAGAKLSWFMGGIRVTLVDGTQRRMEKEGWYDAKFYPTPVPIATEVRTVPDVAMMESPVTATGIFDPAAFLRNVYSHAIATDNTDEVTF